MAVAIGLAVLFVLHKGLYELIKQGHWAEVTSKLMSTDFYLDSIDNVEPFVTQAILNRVLESAYRVPLDSLNSAWFALIPYNLPGGVGAPLSFNDLFQPVLFHGVNWMQMANNVWAQAWAAGGLLLLLLFVFVFLIVLMLGNYLIRAQSSAIRQGAHYSSRPGLSTFTAMICCPVPHAKTHSHALAPGDRRLLPANEGLAFCIP